MKISLFVFLFSLNHLAELLNLVRHTTRINLCLWATWESPANIWISSGKEQIVHGITIYILLL